MDVLKVFVNGSASANTGRTIESLAEGDVLLVKASDHTEVTPVIGAALGDNDEVQVVTKTAKGLVFSTPVSRKGVTYVNYKSPTGATQKVTTVTLADIANDSTTLNKTYTLGVQIKEDLRMGTYNKNTEILGSAVTPSTAYSSAAVAMKDITSSIAKAFAANPLTSTSPASVVKSPQLIKVERTGSGTITALGQTLTVTQGARQVTAGAAITIAAGTVISILGKLYLVETGVTSGTVFTLDTAYQGATATVSSGTNASSVGTLASGVTTNTWAFVFTGVAQARNDRFSQFKMVDFIVTYPKGFDVSGQITVASTAAIVYPVGSWAQVRDLEEKAFTNSQPLINYREFPYEDFTLNASLRASTATYTLITLSHVTSGTRSYNFNQSNYREFPQTTVVALGAAEAAVTESGSPNAADVTVANSIVAWYTGSDTPVTDNAVFGDTTF